MQPQFSTEEVVAPLVPTFLQLSGSPTVEWTPEQVYSILRETPPKETLTPRSGVSQQDISFVSNDVSFPSAPTLQDTSSRVSSPQKDTTTTGITLPDFHVVPVQPPHIFRIFSQDTPSEAPSLTQTGQAQILQLYIQNIYITNVSYVCFDRVFILTGNRPLIPSPPPPSPGNALHLVSVQENMPDSCSFIFLLPTVPLTSEPHVSRPTQASLMLTWRIDPT